MTQDRLDYRRVGVLALAAVLTLGFGLAYSLQEDGGLNPEVIDSAKEALGVLDMTVQWMEVPSEAETTLDIPVTLDGVEHLISVSKHSMRSPDFEVWTTDAAGNRIEAEIPAVRTYRGWIDGVEGSIVAASTTPEGELHATIVLDEIEWIVQPLSGEMGPGMTGNHAVYRRSDVLDAGGVCGNDDYVAEKEFRSDGDDGIAPLGSGLQVCEIACDADREFYNLNGSNVTTTVNDIERVMNSVEIIYERDVSITYEITFIIVRTSEPDPYSSTDPGTLLNQFRNHWNSNLTAVPRDIAHLFTGKNINGGVIGIARLSAICNSQEGYGLSQSRYTSNFALRVSLTAHELGHNWSSGHCSGSDCRIMCPSNGGCTGDVTKFGQSSKNQIIGHRNTRGCLYEHPDAITQPFVDTFPGNIDPDKWSWIRGGVTANIAENEPSEPLALNLDAFGSDPWQQDQIRSNWINLFQNPLPLRTTLSYWTQARGVDAGESLRVEFRASNNQWLFINSVVSDGTTEDYFTFHYHELPTNAKHDRFRVRFLSQVDFVLNDWWLDNVSVAHSDIDVSFTAQASAVPAGGQLFFDAAVQNLVGSQRNSEAWIDVFRPDGSPLFASNPKFGPKSFGVQGFQTKQRTDLRLNINPAMPAGAGYRVVAYIGVFPNEVHHADDFFFTVTN